MAKSKSSKPVAQSTFIDMKEISDTLDKNEDVVKTLINNYHHNMIKVGDKHKSNTASLLKRSRCRNR